MISRDAIPHADRPRDHMPCLDGLRGLAALVVMLGHAADFGLPLVLDSQARDCGVLIFFALSGFLIGDLYLPESPTGTKIKTYAAARVARIVPIYYFVLLAAFIIHEFDPAFIYAVTPVQYLRLLTFNGNVSVFWSIGPEVQFYAVFVSLWILHGRLRRDWLFAALVLVLAGLCVATIHRWPGIFVASKFHIFALGMLMAVLRRRIVGRLPAAVISVSHTLAFAIIAVFLVPGLADLLFGATPFDQHSDPTFARFYGNLPRVLAAAYLALAFSFTSGPAAFVLANPVAAVLGRCSFSLYLLHMPVFGILVRSRLLVSFSGLVATLTILLATALLSLLSYRIIEAPGRRIIRAALLQTAHGSGDIRLRDQPAA